MYKNIYFSIEIQHKFIYLSVDLHIKSLNLCASSCESICYTIHNNLLFFVLKSCSKDVMWNNKLYFKIIENIQLNQEKSMFIVVIAIEQLEKIDIGDLC